ncbi:NepR family anti-sigma factor [Antarctobacter jejuensis]|uniref:NepR family anti-sigma factor n=1 Tax=Antarctobacter jejuensis TaxID=1439938 RepID=UPI003FCF964B
MTNQMTQKKLNSRIAEEIDRNLRQAFDETVQEPVPDRFMDLLSQLKAAEDKGKGGDNA